MSAKRSAKRSERKDLAPERAVSGGGDQCSLVLADGKAGDEVLVIGELHDLLLLPHVPELDRAVVVTCTKSELDVS